MSCLVDSKTPGREVNYIDDQTVPRVWAATILRTDCKEMGTSASQNWRLTVPKATKMMLVRPLMTNWRWLLVMTVLFLHVIPLSAPATLSIKALTPCLSWGGVSLCTNVHHPPPPQVTASEKKQTFLSTNLACLLAFEWWADGPPVTHTLPITLSWISHL